MKSSFKDWLNEQRSRNDAIGDFAVSVAQHVSFPNKIRAMQRFVLEEFGEDARQTLDSAYEEFRGPLSSKVTCFNRDYSKTSREKVATKAVQFPKEPPKPGYKNSPVFANHPILGKLPLKPPGKS